MQVAKFVSFTSALRLAAVLCLLAAALAASAGFAADEGWPEPIPGLDLWSSEPKTAPPWKSGQSSSDLESRVKRHQEFMQAGVPLEYRSRTNPYPAAAKIIHDGGGLYQARCARCHGSKGFGDGEAGKDLMPSPALLTYMVKRPRAVDEYLLWTISEGGAQFGTEMPAFKTILTDDQIWQIVVYMRAGFPNMTDAGQN